MLPILQATRASMKGYEHFARVPNAPRDDLVGQAVNERIAASGSRVMESSSQT
jgi:hypothetical protein